MPLTVLLGALGATGVFIEDDDVPGNNKGQVRSETGVTSGFTYPADALTFTSTKGQILTFDLFDSLAAATLTVGSLSDATQNPDEIAVRKVVSNAAMTMAAANTINESGNDAAADIVATTLTLSAGTGIGVGNALETKVSNLEASTETGGINIVNLTSVTIGGTVGPEGVSVGTSGNLRLEALGSIVLSDSDGVETIAGGSTSGDVTLIARANGSITSTVNQDAVTAAGGNIVLTADGNIRFGVNTDFDNDVRAKGSITVNAGGDFWLDGFSDMASSDFGGGSGGVTINAVKGIFILDSFGTDASVAARGDAGADVVLNAGALATLSLQAQSIAAVSSQSGDVIANADTIVIAIDSGITAAKGVVTLRPTTAGLAIDLGSDSEAGGRLALSDAELDRVFAPTLAIGSASTGDVTVSKSISPANAADVFIQSGTDIVVNAGVVIQVAGKLELRAGDDIVLLASASMQAPDGIIGRVDFGNADPGAGGRAFVDAGFATAVTFIGNTDADKLFGGAAGDTLDGGGGADTLTGRLGDDIYKVDNAGDVVIEIAGQGSDTILSSVDYALKAGVSVELLRTNADAGTAAIDLTGNEFAQTVRGNAGSNILDGREGSDTLQGLSGKDFFVFSSTLGAGNVDTITDFNVADDTIRLENAIFTQLAATGALNAAFFRANTAGTAADGNDFILYDTTDGTLFFDADGNGAGLRVQFATLTGAPAITAADFVVI